MHGVALLCVACQATSEPDAASTVELADNAAHGGALALGTGPAGQSAVSPLGAAGVHAIAPVATATTAGAGASATTATDSSAAPPAGNAAGASAAGSGGEPANDPANHGDLGHGTSDHCVDGFLADPADATVTSEPQQWVSSTGAIDLLLPEPVLDWMHRKHWMESHDAWHNVRRCNSFLTFPNSPTVNICDEHPNLVANFQECSGPEDGYAFLVEHRHMIIGFKQAFPNNAALFDGFERFPFDATGVPEAWRDRFGTGWSAQIVEAARKLDDIENHLDEYPSEGALGQFMQCGGMGGFGGGGGVHAAMHFKWSVDNSPHRLVDQVTDLGNYMFWKLHGWIDDVWERYRVAKGLTREEPALKAALVEQCREMDRLGELFGSDPLGGTRPSDQPRMRAPESGLFAETIRPVLDEKCSGCHSGTAPVGGLSFAKELSSTNVIMQLVNVQSKAGGQLARVKPGEPQQSWFYLKVSDTAKEAACSGTCNTQSMPPTGQVELSSAQLGAITAWISAGATDQ